MEIPESISTLTTDGAADIFISKPPHNTVLIDDIINTIKQKIDLVGYKHFSTGLVSYKQNINQDKNFIKNLLTIYNIAVTEALQTSSIPEDTKHAAIRTYKNTIDGAITNIDAIHSLTNTLNKEENIIDVQQISYIILGYVIDTIKKLNETRDRS
jgi:hypothetical protein